MKIVRFRDESGMTRTGEWRDGEILARGTSIDPEEVDVLPPSQPTKIVCQAGGYVEHRRESDVEEIPDRPEFFLKTPNCVIGHGDAIQLPPGRDDVEFEAEFGVVIDRQCRSVSAEEALEYVRGYTCVNDVSNREDQAEERNWVRGKAFDASLPMGPVLSTPEEIPENAVLQLRHNDEVKQETTTEHMIFSVAELIAEISELITLEPGDVIATGTPYGPDRLSAGDVVEVEFDGVGTLRNPVVEG